MPILLWGRRWITRPSSPRETSWSNISIRNTWRSRKRKRARSITWRLGRSWRNASEFIFSRLFFQKRELQLIFLGESSSPAASTPVESRERSPAAVTPVSTTFPSLEFAWECSVPPLNSLAMSSRSRELIPPNLIRTYPTVSRYRPQFSFPHFL